MVPPKIHARTQHDYLITREIIEKRTTIIDTEPDPRRLLILAALYIKDRFPSINFQSTDLLVLPTAKSILGQHGSQKENDDVTTTGPLDAHPVDF